MLSFIITCLLYISGFQLLSNFLETKTIPKNCNLIISTSYANAIFIFSLLKIFNLISFYTFMYSVPLTISYCIFDTRYLFENNINQKEQLLVHHSILIASNLIVYYYYSDTTPYYINYFLYNYLAEASTPFLNFSIYLHTNKLTNKYPLLYKSSNLLLLINYFIFRIINGIYLIISFYSINLIYFSIQLLLTSMNFIWFYKILKIISKIKKD